MVRMLQKKYKIAKRGDDNAATPGEKDPPGEQGDLFSP
jgi:hypothetical protein